MVRARGSYPRCRLFKSDRSHHPGAPTRAGWAFAFFLAACTASEPPVEERPTSLATTIEGFGAGARGGEVDGGVVAEVTSLADDGPGSLREVLAAVTEPTLVTFAVGGEIALASSILVPGHVTIDGGGAVTLTGSGLHLVDVEDVVVRDLSFRDVRGPGDAVTIEASRTVLLLHCAFDNAGLHPDEPDEFVAVVWGATDVTIAWSRLANTDKVFLFGNGDAPAEVDGDIRVTLHDLVMEGNGRRHPFVRHGQVDLYNSVIADWSLRHEKTYGVRAADGARVRIERVWFEQEGDWPALATTPEAAVALVGSPWLGAVAETEDARIDVVDAVVTDDRIVLEDTDDAFERPYDATLQALDEGWRAAMGEAVGPR